MGHFARQGKRLGHQGRWQEPRTDTNVQRILQSANHYTTTRLHTGPPFPKRRFHKQTQINSNRLPNPKKPGRNVTRTNRERSPPFSVLHNAKASQRQNIWQTSYGTTLLLHQQALFGSQQNTEQIVEHIPTITKNSKQVVRQFERILFPSGSVMFTYNIDRCYLTL